MFTSSTSVDSHSRVLHTTPPFDLFVVAPPPLENSAIYVRYTPADYATPTHFGTRALNRAAKHNRFRSPHTGHDSDTVFRIFCITACNLHLRPQLRSVTRSTPWLRTRNLQLLQHRDYPLNELYSPPWLRLLLDVDCIRQTPARMVAVKIAPIATMYTSFAVKVWIRLTATRLSVILTNWLLVSGIFARRMQIVSDDRITSSSIVASKGNRMRIP
ncbi:hypothetical protein A0H81_10440 [Grifola frondosa]|uniref:Uncharacterized protein n=1 Tax=Grifola frondosa TaxID=5627 RepID=A0A1C7M036_GRIFR|nr:hypothetical protein A0H81_10440 [Grifola frondosa]